MPGIAPPGIFMSFIGGEAGAGPEGVGAGVISMPGMAGGGTAGAGADCGADGIGIGIGMGMGIGMSGLPSMPFIPSIFIPSIFMPGIIPRGLASGAGMVMSVIGAGLRKGFVRLACIERRACGRRTVFLGLAAGFAVGLAAALGIGMVIPPMLWASAGNGETLTANAASNESEFIVSLREKG
jgi:hypothetical protein